MHLLVVILTNPELIISNLLASYNGQQIYQAIRSYMHIIYHMQCMHACNNRGTILFFLLNNSCALCHLTDVDGCNYHCQIK